MAFTIGAVNPLSSLIPGRDTWKVIVRVLRTWEMYPIGDPSKPYAMNVAVIDEQGGKIEAIIKKNMIPKFRGELCEGNVYKITYFAVAVNSGSFRATEHQYKIYFNGRTKAVPKTSDSIPRNGLTLKNSSFIEGTMGECDYLIDTIGVLTAVSEEKKYFKGVNMTRKIELALTDDKGTMKVALFGNYVDMVNQFLSSPRNGLPIVVVQFGKIKVFRDDVVIQNVMNATKIFWNSDMAEISIFRDGVSLNGIDLDMPMGVIDDGVPHVPAEEEFLRMFPRKTIKELKYTVEEGMFIICGKICDVVEGEKWWYTSCRCHKAVTMDDGIYFCSSCSTYVLEVIPRFRVKVEVSDEIDSVNLVLFDNDCQNILQKTCKELIVGSKVKSADEYPEEIKAMNGRMFLFKVEKTSDYGTNYEDTFKVKKICIDPSVIELFNNMEDVRAPLKLIKRGKMELSSSEAGGDYSQGMSEVVGSVVSLDDRSPGDGSPACTSAKSTGSSNKRVRKMKLNPVKIEKE